VPEEKFVKRKSPRLQQKVGKTEICEMEKRSRVGVGSRILNL
jgi:hypothetical protein